MNRNWKMRRMKEMIQEVEKEQKKFSKEKRLQEDREEVEKEIMIKGHLQYIKRRKLDEDLWLKSQFQNIKGRLDAVEKQGEEVQAALKRQRLDTERQKMEKEIKDRIRLEEIERE